jgi:hypothetical protein
MLRPPPDGRVAMATCIVSAAHVRTVTAGPEPHAATIKHNVRAATVSQDPCVAIAWVKGVSASAADRIAVETTCDESASATRNQYVRIEASSAPKVV